VNSLKIFTNNSLPKSTLKIPEWRAGKVFITNMGQDVTTRRGEKVALFTETKKVTKGGRGRKLDTRQTTLFPEKMRTKLKTNEDPNFFLPCLLLGNGNNYHHRRMQKCETTVIIDHFSWLGPQVFPSVFTHNNRHACRWNLASK